MPPSDLYSGTDRPDLDFSVQMPCLADDYHWVCLTLLECTMSKLPLVWCEMVRVRQGQRRKVSLLCLNQSNPSTPRCCITGYISDISSKLCAASFMSLFLNNLFLKESQSLWNQDPGTKWAVPDTSCKNPVSQVMTIKSPLPLEYIMLKFVPLWCEMTRENEG